MKITMVLEREIEAGADCAGLLCLGEASQRERGLAGGFRPIDLDHAPARQAADAERDIEPERAGRDRLDVHRLVILAQLHDRTLAEGALDLGQRGFKGFRLVHGRTFDDTQGSRAHDHAPYGLRFGAPTSRAAPLESTADGIVHCLFSSCNVLFSFYRIRGYWPLLI